MTMLVPWRHATEFDISRICVGLVLVRVVFGLDDDSPTSREDTAVDIELVRFEEVASKDWDDSQILPIGKMYDTGSRRHLRPATSAGARVRARIGETEVVGDTPLVFELV